MATELSPIAEALGRLPTGLYIVTAEQDRSPLGFVASFVLQVAFDPPTVCVAIGRDRPHLAAVRKSGRFGVSILDQQSRGLMSAFFKQDRDPFEGLETTTAPRGTRVLSGALAWLECELSGEHAAGDHVVVFGTVTSAQKHRDAEPAIHLRKNGLDY